MSRASILTLAVISPLLGACMTFPSETVALEYSYDFAAYEKTGSGSLKGQAFLRQKGGGVVVCAGEEVFLLPYVGAFKKAYDLAKAGIRPVVAGHEGTRFSVAAAASPKFSKIIRRTKCDAQGNFFYTDLPPGEWVAATVVRWIVADIPQGSSLSSIVQINSNREAFLLLSDSDKV